LQQENDYWERKNKVKRTRRDEKTRARKSEVVWLKALVCTNYRCDWSIKRYKAVTLIKIHVIVITYTQRLDSIIVIDCMHLMKKKKKKRLQEELEILYVLQESQCMMILQERFMRVEMYSDSTRNLTKVETYDDFHAL